LSSINNVPNNSRVFIYGTGSAGRSLWMWLKKCRTDVVVLGFIDSFKKGRVGDKVVYSFADWQQRFKANEYDLVLVASGAGKQIAAGLETIGIPFILISVPSYLMENLLPLPFKEKWLALKIKFLAFFVQRKLHLFLGEHGGKFIGNNKYYYLYLKQNTTLPVYWVVEDEALFLELVAQGVDVLNFKSPRFLFILLSGAFFYFDNMTWQRKYPWLRFFKARIIHMSHGVGLKLTEKMLIPQEFMLRLTRTEQVQLESRIFKNDLLVSTSSFYAENVSVPAYGTVIEDVTLCGYPKNDLFYQDIKGAEIFSDAQTLARIRSLQSQNYKIIVYAPTFRDMDSGFQYADVIDYAAFNRFLAEQRLLLVIKGHTSLSAGIGVGESYDHILFYQNERDGYPLLKEADLLITDYSSIYMDFLHCNKPILFFVYDYEEYIEKHREIQFDYMTMTPGPKAQSYEALIHWVHHFLVLGADGFLVDRERVSALAFTYFDGLSSHRLFREMQKRRMIA